MKKRCTNQHFIEYLSYNYVEKQCLIARCIWQRNAPDYGFDGFIRTVNKRGELENGQIDVQVKSTSKIKKLPQQNCFALDVAAIDVETWLYDKNLTILVLYDAKKDVGYYLEIAKYFREHRQALRKIKKFVRVYFPQESIFNAKAVSKLRKLKNG